MHKEILEDARISQYCLTISNRYSTRLVATLDVTRFKISWSTSKKQAEWYRFESDYSLIDPLFSGVYHFFLYNLHVFTMNFNSLDKMFRKERNINPSCWELLA